MMPIGPMPTGRSQKNCIAARLGTPKLQSALPYPTTTTTPTPPTPPSTNCIRRDSAPALTLTNSAQLWPLWPCLCWVEQWPPRAGGAAGEGRTRTELVSAVSALPPALERLIFRLAAGPLLSCSLSFPIPRPRPHGEPCKGEGGAPWWCGPYHCKDYEGRRAAYPTMQEHLSDSHVCPDGAKATVLPRRWQRLSVPGHHPFALTGWKKPQCQSACQPPVSVSCQADCQAGPRGLKSSSQFYFVLCIYFF